MNRIIHLTLCLILCISCADINVDSSSSGSDYGDEAKITAPVLSSTSPKVDVSGSTANIQTTLLDNGGAKEIKCNLCYGTTKYEAYDVDNLVSSGKLVLVSAQVNNNVISVTLNNLIEGAEYYAMVIVRNSGGVCSSDLFSFKTEYTGPSSENPVDLGLSVKWAGMNLGATAPQKEGSIYMWGETRYVTNYMSASYSLYNSKTGTYKKYGPLDGLKVLKQEDDAAYQRLGTGWRIPTKEEVDELNNNCTFTSVTYNGVRGIAVRSKVKGYENKSIFFAEQRTVIKKESGTGYTTKFEITLWTSSLDGWFDPYVVHSSSSNSSFGLMTSYNRRYCIFAIRPVHEK